MICWRYSRSPTVTVLKRGHSGTCWRLAEGGDEAEEVDEDVDAATAGVDMAFDAVGRP